MELVGEEFLLHLELSSVVFDVVYLEGMQSGTNCLLYFLVPFLIGLGLGDSYLVTLFVFSLALFLCHLCFICFCFFSFCSSVFFLEYNSSYPSKKKKKKKIISV